MHDRVGRPLDGLKCLFYNMFSRLGEHLHGHVLGNHVPLNQRAHKLVFGLRRGGESHLDFLKADID